MAARRRRHHGTTTVEDMERCRLWGHAWYPYDAEPARGGWKEVLSCERCTTRRAFIIDRNGFVVSKAYDYVDGYRDATHTYDSKQERRAAYYASELREKLAEQDELKERRSRRKAS